MFEGGAGRPDESDVKSGSSEEDCREADGENMDRGSESESSGRCMEKN